MIKVDVADKDDISVYAFDNQPMMSFGDDQNIKNKLNSQSKILNF